MEREAVELVQREEMDLVQGELVQRELIRRRKGSSQPECFYFARLMLASIDAITKQATVAKGDITVDYYSKYVPPFVITNRRRYLEVLLEQCTKEEDMSNIATAIRFLERGKKLR
jgi:hypothetical protein